MTLNIKEPRLFFLPFFFLLLSSCAYHMGGFSGNSVDDLKNSELVDIGIGKAKATRIFGIGGLGKEALILEAKKDLYKNYPLRKGQAYANISFDIRNALYLIVTQSKATVSADIISFPDQEGSVSDGYQELFDRIRSVEITSVDQILLGDTVLILAANLMEANRVVGIKNSKQTLELAPLAQPVPKTRRYPKAQVYLTKDLPTQKQKGIIVGKTLKYRQPNGQVVIGTIVGLGFSDVLIEFETNSGKYYKKKPYSEFISSPASKEN